MLAAFALDGVWIWIGIFIALLAFIVPYWWTAERQPEECRICKAQGYDYVPALDHDKCCELRLEFFGGEAQWDQDELQVRDGVVFYFDRDVHSWRPQGE